MRQKGFTLAEVLGVITIIGLLLVLIIPMVIDRISSSGEEAANTENELIFNAAEQYVKEHSSEYPSGKSGRYCISIQTLIDDGKLAEPVVDVTTGEDISDKSVMMTIYSSGNIDYELKEGDECEELSSLPFIDFIVEPSGSSWVKSRKVTIIYPTIDGDYEASHRIDSGSWVRDSSADNGGNIEITFTEAGTLEARLKGSQTISSKISISNVDSETPVVRSVSTPSEWSNKTQTATATVYDGVSGIAGYYLSTSSTAPSEDDSNWVSVSYDAGEVTIELTNLSNGTYYLWVKDKAGNVSETTPNSQFVINNIDTVAPTCTINVVDGKEGNNGWYTSDVLLDLDYSDDLSGVASYGITTSQTASYNGNDAATITSDTTGIIYYGYVMDQAGNTSTCNITVKRDATAPTCSLDINGTEGNNGWYRSNVNVSLTKSDATSGVSSYGISTSSSATYNSLSSTTQTADTNTITYYGYAMDAAGNTCQTSTSFKKDSTAPTPPYLYDFVSLSNCSISNSTCNGSNLSCSVTITVYKSGWQYDLSIVEKDNLSGVKTVEVYHKPSEMTSNSDYCNWTTLDECRFRAYATAPFTIDLRYRVIDYAGNVSQVASGTINVARGW